jgi:carboxypeptidase Q
MSGGAAAPDPDAYARMPALDRASLRRDVERLAALGPRFAGTPGDARGRRFVAEELTAAGLAAVREEPFQLLGYAPGESRCEVVGSDFALPCAGLQATAAAAVEAEAIYVGAGDEDSLAALAARGVELTGRIVVVRSGVPMIVVPGLVERGAAGVVVLGVAPDGLLNHFTAAFYPPPAAPPWEGRVLPVPGVTVEAEAGERLVALLSAGPTRLRLEHRASYEDAASANVVAEIPGADPAAPRVVVGAHHDTQLESPGAADNGTGVAALLAIGRAFAGLRPARTIELVAFGAEEPAAWGATAFVARRDPATLAAMVNLDALGPPVQALRTIVADPRLASFAADSARATGWEVEVELDARDFPYADHAPFIDAGVPSCWIWRYPPPHPYYHSAGDTPRWVDQDLLAEDANASALTVYRLATEDVLPFR